MKRMKALLGVVLVIAMVLSLGITAFAAGGNIIVADAGSYTYDIYKVFDLDPSDPENYVYTLDTRTAQNPTGAALLAALQDVDTDGETGPDTDTGFHDLILTESATTGVYNVKKTDTFSAEAFAKWLEDHTDKLVQIDTDVAGATMQDPGYPVTTDGYYYIQYSNGTPFALTTVDNKNVQIQNKKDIPFDKDVYDDAGNDIHDQSVELGDILHYTITGKVADANGNTQYNYLVWDKLGDGLKFNTDSVKVYVQALTANGDVDTTATKTEITNLFAVDSLNQTPITSTPKDTIWVNTSDPADYTDVKPSFVANVDIKALNDLHYTGMALIIEYTATVTKDLGVLTNTAHLVSNDLIKDAQTQNYTSKITLDKYETGNASQKLAGAEFILYKEDASGNRTYYKNDGTQVTWVALADNTDATAIADATSASPTMTVKVTETDGSADFTGLEDGTYYLIETKAPAGYVKLETPIEVVVNGKASLDPNNTVENNPTATATNQNIQLTNVSHIANTPGSVLPSTGGRGTTMLYMAGLGMMLAAGAFLIFRRRAEAGK